MRGEDDGRFLLVDGGDDLGDRRRGERRLGAGPGLAGLEDDAFRGDLSHVENLRPAEAEPAVADHQHLLAGGELAGDGFHAEGAAAGHDDGRPGVVDMLQDARDVLHDALEALRHVVQGAVGIDH